MPVTVRRTQPARTPERARYEEALQKIQQIGAMVRVSAGELSANAADTKKSQANMVLAFYPAFQRVEAQTVFFALLFLEVPMVLNLLGFGMARWFSLYPLYGWTGVR